MPDEIKILDVEQAAEALRMTTRRLIKVAKKHGLCLKYGRKLMFTAAHLAGLMEVMQCPPNSSEPLIDKRRVSAALSDPDKAFESLRARAIARSQKRAASKKKTA